MHYDNISQKFEFYKYFKIEDLNRFIPSVSFDHTLWWFYLAFYTCPCRTTSIFRDPLRVVPQRESGGEQAYCSASLLTHQSTHVFDLRMPSICSKCKD